ncbi:hypothetical protein M0805_005959 [Coniferiporia weirii]|nr:hypothetical protein M0805_005959 [Coniferiporia weirii]
MSTSSTGPRPEGTVPPVCHPAPYHRLAVLAIRDGLLIRPMIPGVRESDSCTCISWGNSFEIEELAAANVQGADYDWQRAAVVLGILGCLKLNFGAYVLVVTAKNDVGFFLDKRNEVYAIKSVSAIPMQESQARSVIDTIGTKFNQANIIQSPLPSDVTKSCDLRRPHADANFERTPSVQTENVKLPDVNVVGDSSLHHESEIRSSSPTPSAISSVSSRDSIPTSGPDKTAPVTKTLASRLSFWTRLPGRSSGHPDNSEEGRLLQDGAQKSHDKQPSEVMQELTQDTSPTPANANEQQNDLDEKVLKECIKIFTKGEMYFSYNFDMTTSLQHKHHEVARLRRKAKAQSENVISAELASEDVEVFAEPYPTLPLWRRVTRQFWWNENMLQPFINARLHSYVLPVMQGFYQIASFHIPRNPGTFEADDKAIVDYIVISRRSRDRAGLRYQRRGIDDDANVANFVETEVVVRVEREGVPNIFSYIQTRGSIPLFWTQSGYSLKPPPTLSPERTHQQNLGALRRHFAKTIPRYGPHTVVNLAEQHGKEAAITKAYGEYVEELGSKDVKYIKYDFHAETKGMKYENILKLILEMGKTFDAHGFTWISGSTLMSEQKAVFRINCIDCLDRTNVVQSAFARHLLDRQLGAVALSNFAVAGLSEVDMVFNDVWANNGDAISRAYAGTSALKGDYTRTGKRDLGGMLNDGMSSLARMYSSTFSDWFLQAVIDFMLGYRTFSVFFEFLLKLRSTDPRDRMRIDNIRAEAIATSVSRVLSEGERLLSGWTLLSPAEMNMRVSCDLEEKIVLLSAYALYIISYDYTLEKVSRYSRVPLNQIVGITKGAYILSPLDEGSRDHSQNYGFMIRYRTSSETTRTTSYSVRNVTDSVSGIQLSPQRTGTPGKGGGAHSRMLINVAAESGGVISFAAFKALPVDPARARRMTGSFEEAADNLCWAKTCKEAVESIVGSVQQAVKDAGAERSDFVLESDIVSLEDAQRATTLVAKMEYGLKRLIWLGS